jgi:hypothetical protein
VAHNGRGYFPACDVQAARRSREGASTGEIKGRGIVREGSISSVGHAKDTGNLVGQPFGPAPQQPVRRQAGNLLY